MDYISREDAIQVASTATLSINETVVMLKKLPTVNPERPKGERMWKERNKGAIDYVTGIDMETGEKRTIQVDNRHTVKRNYCSLCGKIGDDTFMNYCPNCGAEMREE